MLVSCFIHMRLNVNESFDVKFGLSEKHKKFEINLPYGFDKSDDLLDKHQNHEDFFLNYV